MNECYSGSGQKTIKFFLASDDFREWGRRNEWEEWGRDAEGLSWSRLRGHCCEGGGGLWRRWRKECLWRTTIVRVQTERGVKTSETDEWEGVHEISEAKRNDWTPIFRQREKKGAGLAVAGSALVILNRSVWLRRF